MLKNVTIRNASGEIVGTYETFSSKESEQREALRRAFGPGRYKVSYNKNGPKNVWVFVGAQGPTETARPIAPFAGLPQSSSVDLTIYRELILPMAQNITDRLEEIKNMLADAMSDDELPSMQGTETSDTQPEPKDQATRIAEALQRIQNGEPIEGLIGEYADLIPPQFAGMAPAMLAMLGGQKGGE